MKDKHIIEILDEAPLSGISVADMDFVNSHTKECESCRNAYKAAQLSTLAIMERAKLTVEPSPFFQTRVMAAWKEQQSVENVPALLRLWNSTRALVSSMAVTTAALAALSFFLPATQVQTYDDTASAYSAEAIILGQGNDDQMTYEQVLSTIYADDDDAR